ncbi:hypothetical protein [Luteimonas sp. gir]|uniref:hypothetical protein n=1 Tax=Luteimonas sp. gir TaxID=3127960 RepID=UPI003075E6C6
MSEVNGGFDFKILLDVAGNSGVGEVSANRRGGEKGWLTVFAEAMGKVMQKQVDEIQKFSESIGTKPSPADSTELTAMTQNFQMFMNAVSTALKSMGEAAAGMARKQ